jgi:hypothetical protein
MVPAARPARPMAVSRTFLASCTRGAGRGPARGREGQDGRGQGGTDHALAHASPLRPGSRVPARSGGRPGAGTRDRRLTCRYVHGLHLARALPAARAISGKDRPSGFRRRGSDRRGGRPGGAGVPWRWRRGVGWIGVHGSLRSEPCTSFSRHSTAVVARPRRAAGGGGGCRAAGAGASAATAATGGQGSPGRGAPARAGKAEPFMPVRAAGRREGTAPGRRAGRRGEHRALRRRCFAQVTQRYEYRPAGTGNRPCAMATTRRRKRGERATAPVSVLSRARATGRNPKVVEVLRSGVRAQRTGLASHLRHMYLNDLTELQPVRCVISEPPVPMKAESGTSPGGHQFVAECTRLPEEGKVACAFSSVREASRRP